MRLVKLCLAAISLSLMTALNACGGSDSAVEVAFARVGGLNFASWPPGFYQARTEQEWETVWAQRETAAFPVSPIPAVDFAREMVVGVSEGMGPNGCHDLSITRVIEGDSELVVEYLRSVPHFDPAHPIACTLGLVPLVDFITTRQSDKPVRFVRTET
jgi:hypothetical protein